MDAPPPLHTLDPLNNLREAYYELVKRVDRALLTQVGDEARLSGTRGEVLSLLEAARMV